MVVNDYNGNNGSNGSNVGIADIFEKHVPAFVMKKTDAVKVPDKEEFIRFEAKSGRRAVMAEYWFDVINEVRREYLL